MALALIVALAGSGVCVGERSSAPLKQHLPNGLRLVIEDNDHTATVVMSALVRVTALHEPRGKTGIRQLTGMLVARGDACRELLAQSGIRGDVVVAPDYIELVLAAPVEALDECARAMREMLFSPLFSEEALRLTRDSLVRGLAAREEVPVGLAHRRLFDRIYPGVGAADGSAGDPIEVAQLTLHDVRDFHAAHYLPNATVVAVSGGVEATRARDALSQVMRGVLPGAPARTRPEPQAGSTEPVVIEVGGNTSVYAVGGRAVALSEPVYPAMAVGMTILGSGMGSRLYRELRVDRSVAYTIVSELTPGSTTPSGFVLVTCDTADLDEVQRVVDREIESMMSRPADPEQLQRAKQYLIGRHALRRQRNQDIAHYLGVFELLGGVEGFRRGRQLPGEIAAVSGQDVAEAMRRLFSPAWSVQLVACND